MKKLDYCDLKNAIESLKNRIQEEEVELQINLIVLKTFEKEIKNCPPPIKPQKSTEEEKETNHLG